MDKDTLSSAENHDLEATVQKAGKLQDSAYHMIDLKKVSRNAVNRHPEPVHEPVMPAEVFYNRMELDEDFDPHEV